MLGWYRVLGVDRLVVLLVSGRNGLRHLTELGRHHVAVLDSGNVLLRAKHSSRDLECWIAVLGPGRSDLIPIPIE